MLAGCRDVCRLAFANPNEGVALGRNVSLCKTRPTTPDWNCPVPSPIRASVWKQVTSYTTCALFVITMVSQWNVILPSLVARRYATYGLHRFLFFFLPFFLSLYMLMSVFIFSCCSDFPLTLYLFVPWFLFVVYCNDLHNCVFRQILGRSKEDEMSRTCSSHGREGKPTFSRKR